MALVSLTAQPDPTTTEPPVFKKVFGNATVEEGGPLVFDCTITGRPTPQVRFLFFLPDCLRVSCVIKNLGRFWLSLPNRSSGILMTS